MDKKLKAIIRHLIDFKKLDDMTPKKLQKLLYYCYSWHLALTAENNAKEEIQNCRLFDNNFQAWVHGPVVPEVYHHFKTYQGNVIEKSGFDDISPQDFLNSDEIGNIDDVADTYGTFNGRDLELLSHDELPWKEAREGYDPLQSSNNIISDTTIYDYYSKRLV